MTLEAYQKLKAYQCDGIAPEKLPTWFYSEEIFGDVEEAYNLFQSLGFEIKIKSFRQGLFVGVEQRLDIRQKYEETVFPSPGIINHATHVHIPNIGLLSIDEVINADDCCTINLQSLLNEGWHILAVCPPNGTRRPDYILGRTKERKER